MVAARTFADLDWPRRTTRLTLRPAAAGDASAMYAYRSLPEVSRWMSRQPTDPAAFAAFMGQHLDVQLVVERDGEVIGDAMIRVEDAWGQDEVAEGAVRAQAELGWCLAPAAWGQGYATELAGELLAIAFDGLGVRRIHADCFADNVGSRRVMEKLGLRPEAHLVAESLHRELGWVDSLSYALLADEWRAAARG